MVSVQRLVLTLCLLATPLPIIAQQHVPPPSTPKADSLLQTLDWNMPIPELVAVLDSLAYDLYNEPASELKLRQVITHIIDTTAYPWQTNSQAKEAVGNNYIDLGYLYENENDYVKAKEALIQATAPGLLPEDFTKGRYVYEPLGNIYTRLGANTQALELLQRFLGITQAAYTLGSEDPDYRAALADAYNDVARAFWNSGALDSAKHYLSKGLEIPDLSARRKGLLHVTLAYTLWTGKDTLAAYQHINQGIFYQEKAANQAIANNDFNGHFRVCNYLLSSNRHKVVIAQALGRLNDAEAAISQAERYGSTYLSNSMQRGREWGKLMVAKAQLQAVKQQWPQAIATCRRALQDVVPNYAATNNTLPSPDSLPPEVTVGEALTAMADIYVQWHKATLNAQYLRQALDVERINIESERQLRAQYQTDASKLALAQSVHHRGSQVLGWAYVLNTLEPAPAILEQAFVMAEKTKGILLSEALWGLQADTLQLPQVWLTRDSLDNQIRELERQVYDYATDTAKEAQRSAFQHQLDSMYQLRLQLGQVLQQEYPDYYELKYGANTIDLPTLQARLKSNHTELVLYHTGEQHTYAFHLDGTMVQLYRINPEPRQAIARLLQQLNTLPSGDAPTQELNTTAHMLYRQLLAPIPLTHSNSTLCIVPDGQIGLLPFEILLTQPPTTAPYGQQPLLLAQRNILYAPSAKFLLREHKATTTQKALGLAPVNWQNPELPPLRKSAIEIEALDRLLNGNIAIEANATEAFFKQNAPNYGLIHLATHAKYDPRNPYNSWIAFSDAGNQPTEDVYLYASELYSLNLQADLVFLSGCETAQGMEAAGEGILSLARNFGYSGSRNTACGLWELNDASTAKLVELFYGHVNKGKPFAEALRLAKLDYLKDPDPLGFDGAHHPFFWAGVVLIGQNGTLEQPSSPPVVLIGFVLAVLGLALFGWRIRRKAAQSHIS